MGNAIRSSNNNDDFEEKHSSDSTSSTRRSSRFSSPRRSKRFSSSNSDPLPILPHDIVLAKITNSKQFQQKLGSSMNRMRHFAKQVSDVEELKQSYLSTDWLHTVELYKESTVEDDEDEEDESQRRHCSLMTSSTGGAVHHHHHHHDHHDHHDHHLNISSTLSHHLNTVLGITSTETNSNSEALATPTATNGEEGITIQEQEQQQGHETTHHQEQYEQEQARVDRAVHDDDDGVATTTTPTTEEQKNFFDSLLEFEEIPERELDSLKNLLFMEKIRIKLLISETAARPSKRAIRQLVSPLLNSLHVLPELGMFHSALIIGPWKLEFNDSGVVVPRKIISSAAVLTADIDHITTVNRFNDIVNKLAEVIVKWNTTMQYKENGGDKTKVGNCQDFVDDVLQALDIKLNFDGPMAKFIERLRKTGKCNLQFEPDPAFIEQYGLSEKLFKFTDHGSLDRFVNDLLKKNPNLMAESRSEWALLKSFDRAFWLKNAKFPERREYLPHCNEHGVLGCPFGDPSHFSFICV